MTRKDYEAIARAIRNARKDHDAEATGDWDYISGSHDAFEAIIEKLMYELSLDNPRFNAEKFKQATES